MPEQELHMVEGTFLITCPFKTSFMTKTCQGKTTSVNAGINRSKQEHWLKNYEAPWWMGVAKRLRSCSHVPVRYDGSLSTRCASAIICR